MSDNYVSVPNLSDVTTEIDIDSMESACSSWDSSVASVDINSGNFKSKFKALNSNGVGVQCVNSIASSLEQMSSLVSSISSFLKVNLDNQTAVDDSLLSNSSETTDLANQIPKDQNGLSGYGGSSGGSSSGGGGSSGLDGSYGSTSSVDNSNKDLNVTTGTTNSSELSDDFINELSVSLTSIAKNNNITLSQLLNDEKYNDILNQTMRSIASNYSISSSSLEEVGINVIKDRILSANNSTSTISDFSKNIVYNYVTNIADFNNMSANEVVSKYSSYFTSLAKDIGNVVNSNSSLIDVYDGNDVGSFSSESVNFIRGVVDVVASDNSVSSEEILTDSNYTSYVCDKLSEISSVLKSL